MEQIKGEHNPISVLQLTEMAFLAALSLRGLLEILKELALLDTSMI